MYDLNQFMAKPEYNHQHGLFNEVSPQTYGTNEINPD